MKKVFIACVMALLCACEKVEITPTPIEPVTETTQTESVTETTVDYVLIMDSASESFYLVDTERNGLDYVLTFQNYDATSPEQVIKVCNKNGISTLVCTDVTIKLFYTWRVVFSDYVKIDIVGNVEGHPFSFRSCEVPTMN